MKKILLACLALGIAQPVYPASFTVDSLADGVDANPGDGLCATADGNCSLRAAVMEANALAGPDNIELLAGTYNLTIGDNNENMAAEGDLDILDDLTINGAGPDVTLITGNANRYRIFSILSQDGSPLPVVTLKNMKLMQGMPDLASGALILNKGDLTLDNIELTDASPMASALVNYRQLTISNSRIYDNNNSPGSERGVLTLVFGSTTLIERSEIYSNTSYLSPVTTGGKLTIRDSFFRNNTASTDGGALFVHEGSSTTVINTSFTDNTASGLSSVGGAISFEPSSSRSFAELNIYTSSFSGNSAYSGGAIHAQGYARTNILRVNKSIFENNRATCDYCNGGGALNLNRNIQILEFSENIIRSNSSSSGGGGITLYGSTGTVQFSEISGNTARYGGGIYIGTLPAPSLENLTIANNVASSTGGGIHSGVSIFHFGSMELTHITLAGNTAPTGGGIHLANANASAKTPLLNSIIQSADGSANCNVNITSLGYNLSSDDTCGLAAEGDQQSTDPLLSALADNGGFSQTMALQPGSPAIDAGNSNICINRNPLDQRYYSRDPDCDIGAYEAASSPAQAGTLSFAATNTSVDEADTTVSLTVSRTGGSDGIVSVTIIDTSTGSASYYDDYSFTEATLKWADGDSSDKTVDITIVDDPSLEGNETINLAFQTPLFLPSGASASTSEATVTIVDDEHPGEIQFSSAAHTVGENGNSIQITVERINGNMPVQIDYATADGTATAGEDYVATDGTLSFLSSEHTATFSVYITDDSLIEGDETIVLTLSNPQGGLALGDPVTATLTITDDDMPVAGEISIEQGNYSIDEGNSLTLRLLRSNGAEGEVSISITATEGTALESSDYRITSPSTVTFADGQTSMDWTIDILNDNDIESTETFTVTLSDPTGGASIGATSSATIEISNTTVDTGGSGGGGGGSAPPLMLLIITLIGLLRHQVLQQRSKQ